MSLIQTIKAAQLQARKAKSFSVPVLTTLIGEADAVGKNNGNREVTDAEVVAMIKKFVKNLDEVIKVAPAGSSAHGASLAEKGVLEAFLPQQLSEAELKVVLADIIDVGEPNMGQVMKELKAKYDGQYDGALASKLIKEMLA